MRGTNTEEKKNGKGEERYRREPTHESFRERKTIELLL